MKLEETVLIYIEKDGQYLLLFRDKKTKDMNKGKYLGIGGHIEPGETPDQAVVRETKEETNLDLLHYIHRGNVLFKSQKYLIMMYLYTADEFTGTLCECNEGTLSWHDINSVTSLPIWEGDKYFLEKLVNNSPFFEMSLIYNHDTLIEVKDNIVL